MDRKALSLSHGTSSGMCTDLLAVMVMVARGDSLTETPDGTLDVPKIDGFEEKA